MVLHFPAEIHRNKGVSEVAPQLLRALDVERIAAVQFLKNGRVCVTCKTAEYRDDLLEGSTLLFGDVPIPVTAADQPIRFVFVRDLPFEVLDDDIKSVFECFSVVHSVCPCFFREFPSVANGTRRLEMSFRGSIPSSVSVADFPVRVFHAGHPVICSICQESGHLPRGCPFSGLCLRCKQPGHVGRNCLQPWARCSSSTPVPVAVSSTPSAPVSMSVDSQVCTSVSAPSTASTSSISTVSSPVSAISAPFSSVPPATTVAASVSSVTAVSTPVPSVLPVSSSVPSSSSSTSVRAPVSSCAAASVDEDVSMPLEFFVAGVPSSRPPVSSRPPSVSSVD